MEIDHRGVRTTSFLLDLALNLEKHEDDEDLGRVFLVVLGVGVGPREREKRRE